MTTAHTIDEAFSRFQLIAGSTGDGKETACAMTMLGWIWKNDENGWNDRHRAAMSAEIGCAACGESVPHTMTHGLEGEPALWNDRLSAKGSQYAKCDEMTAEKWLTYLEQSATIAPDTPPAPRTRFTLGSDTTSEKTVIVVSSRKDHVTHLHGTLHFIDLNEAEDFAALINKGDES